VWARRTPPAGAPEQAPRNRHFERRLDELELSTAAARLLDGAGITTVGELCRQSEASLLKRGFGRKRLAEVKQILAELGLSLGMR
jgi:DNA-directed RNA polymerase subunit alpha